MFKMLTWLSIDVEESDNFHAGLASFKLTLPYARIETLHGIVHGKIKETHNYLKAG